MQKPIIYGASIFCNCYKLQLACARLDIEYEWREIDIVPMQAARPA